MAYLVAYDATSDQALIASYAVDADCMERNHSRMAKHRRTTTRPGSRKPNRLKAIRERLDCSQEEIADIVGVSKHTISRWENMNSSIPGYRLDAIAQAYGIQVAEIYDADHAHEEADHATREAATYDQAINDACMAAAALFDRIGIEEPDRGAALLAIPAIAEAARDARARALDPKTAVQTLADHLWRRSRGESRPQ